MRQLGLHIVEMRVQEDRAVAQSVAVMRELEVKGDEWRDRFYGVVFAEETPDLSTEELTAYAKYKAARDEQRLASEGSGR